MKNKNNEKEIKIPDGIVWLHKRQIRNFFRERFFDDFQMESLKFDKNSRNKVIKIENLEEFFEKNRPKLETEFNKFFAHKSNKIFFKKIKTGNYAQKNF